MYKLIEVKNIVGDTGDLYDINGICIMYGAVLNDLRTAEDPVGAPVSPKGVSIIDVAALKVAGFSAEEIIQLKLEKLI